MRYTHALFWVIAQWLFVGRLLTAPVGSRVPREQLGFVCRASNLHSPKCMSAHLTVMYVKAFTVPNFTPDHQAEVSVGLDYAAEGVHEAAFHQHSDISLSCLVTTQGGCYT